MGMFSRPRQRRVPNLNTASLPDLIFTLLFFFMIVTDMRESSSQIELNLPSGSSLENTPRSSVMHYLYIGMKDGREYVQFDNKVFPFHLLEQTLQEVYSELDEAKRSEVSIVLSIDGKVEMRLVDEVRNMMKKIPIIKVNYQGKDNDIN